MKKLKLTVVKRNPFVRLALFKQAGKHGKTTKALRRQARVDLKCQ